MASEGSFTAEEFLAARKPRGHPLFPPTTLVEMENTHNRAGGVVVTQTEASERVRCGTRATTSRRISTARGCGTPRSRPGSRSRSCAAPFDVVSVAFSKGLGAPGGALLAGPRDVIARAIRSRRMLGGAMRQVGIFAAAALYALDHHVERLADDHVNARLIAEHLAGLPQVDLDITSVQTNIVIFNLREEAIAAAAFVEAARRRGVLVVAFGPRTVRAVTHLDVTRDECCARGSDSRRGRCGPGMTWTVAMNRRPVLANLRTAGIESADWARGRRPITPPTTR